MDSIRCCCDIRAMQVDLFRGEGRVFAVVASGGEDRLPRRHGPWTAFKTVEMVRGQPMPGVDVDECLDDIDRFGVHVTDAHVRITEDVLR